MKISIVSIFAEIFTSFLETSLIGKAQTNGHLEVQLYNPREKCTDPHQQIDDLIYGGWAGMLLKAQPIIDTVEEIIKNEAENSDFSILFPAPSETLFSQKIAYWQSKKDHLIFICGRYEGIDHRCELYFQKKYPSAFKKLSLGQFIVLGWETPTMLMIEAITRLIPWVIKEKQSRIEESYAIKDGMLNLEAPNYTRPEVVYDMKVPEILLSGNLEEIKQRKSEHTNFLPS